MNGTTLESRTSVLVVLEHEHVTKIDKVAGPGNRSSYIRWLIDTIDESNLKREIELEAMNRVLQKLPMQLEKRIVARDLKIAELKNRLHLIKEGKPEEEAVVDLDMVYDEYIAWRENRWKYGSGVDTTKEEKWLQPRAKMLDMGVNELLLILRKRYRFGEVGNISETNQDIHRVVRGV